MQLDPATVAARWQKARDTMIKYNSARVDARMQRVRTLAIRVIMGEELTPAEHVEFSDHLEKLSMNGDGFLASVEKAGEVITLMLKVLDYERKAAIDHIQYSSEAYHAPFLRKSVADKAFRMGYFSVPELWQVAMTALGVEPPPAPAPPSAPQPSAPLPPFSIQIIPDSSAPVGKKAAAAKPILETVPA